MGGTAPALSATAYSFPQFQRERLVWRPSQAEEPFALTLAELFRPV